MKPATMAVAVALALGASIGAAHAQTSGGSANNPNAPGNVVPAPSAGPTDPAANDRPSARVPTDSSKTGGPGSMPSGTSSEGSASGTGPASNGSGAGGTPRTTGETGPVPGSEAQGGVSK